MARLAGPIAALSLALSALPAAAQEDFTGARSLGMGGAHRAIVSGNDAVYLNPAGLSIGRKYAIEAGYLFGPGRETHVGNVSIVDSVTSSVAAGIAYSYVNGLRTLPTGKVGRTGHVAHLAISLPIARNVLFGVGGKYMDLSYGGRTAVNAVTVDAGIYYRVSPIVALSLVGYGLTNTGSAESPLAMAVGLAVGPPQTFTLAVDWGIDFTSRKYLEDLAIPFPRERSVAHQIRAGLEWLPARFLAVRAGYFHDRVTRVDPDNGLGVGLGFFSVRSRIGFNIAYEQRFNNTDERLLVFALQLFLQ